jgi:chemotaxis response regulator CheB
LIQVIEADPSLKVVGEADDGEAALAQIETLRPDIAVSISTCRSWTGSA